MKFGFQCSRLLLILLFYVNSLLGCCDSGRPVTIWNKMFDMYF